MFAYFGPAARILNAPLRHFCPMCRISRPLGFQGTYPTTLLFLQFFFSSGSDSFMGIASHLQTHPATQCSSVQLLSQLQQDFWETIYLSGIGIPPR